MRKVCKKCGEEKEIELFGNAKQNKDGHRGVCKVCVAEYYKEYCSINYERVSEYGRHYRKDNAEKMAVYNKKYQEDNREKLAEYKKDWHNNKRNTDIEYKILCNLRRRIHKAIKGTAKSASTMELIGCTYEEFMQYLGAKFTNGMTLENYGEWHIDHIIPCVCFDLTKEDEQRKCFNYKNLQPLWAKDNLRKSKKILDYDRAEIEG